MMEVPGSRRVAFGLHVCVLFLYIESYRKERSMKLEPNALLARGRSRTERVVRED